MLDCLRVPQQCHYYEHGWVVIGCGRVQEALQVHGEKLRKRVLQDSQCLHRKANGPVLMLAGVHVAEGALLRTWLQLGALHTQLSQKLSQAPSWARNLHGPYHLFWPSPLLITGWAVAPLPQLPLHWQAFSASADGCGGAAARSALPPGRLSFRRLDSGGVILGLTCRGALAAGTASASPC